MNIKDLIILETDDFIVLNKPAGLLSIPDREGKEISLKVLLLEKMGSIFTVHRLDRGTSGLIVFAKSAAMHKHLSEQFQERKTEKIYLGLVIGSLENLSGAIDLPLAEHSTKKGMMVIHSRGKQAITNYQVLEDFGIYSWLQFHILTGRTHQIRIHMKDAGHPLVCDDLYGDGKPVLISSFKKKFKLSKDQEEERPILSRLALHAWKLKFTDLAGELIELEAPPPKDLQALLQQLAKRKKANRQ